MLAKFRHGRSRNNRGIVISGLSGREITGWHGIPENMLRDSTTLLGGHADNEEENAQPLNYSPLVEARG